MDKSHVQYSLNNCEPNITFHENSIQLTNQCANVNASAEFAKFFSIDDDDIIILDQSESIINEVNNALNRIINKILRRENHHSQILNFGTKRSLDFNNDEEYLLNKKVRFSLPDQDHQDSLFISENLNYKIPAKPYAQFLYHLGFDLCLEQNFNANNNNNNSLSQSTKQTLRKNNQVFHQHETYSCKYCSFRTDVIHVMDYHYRTPHILTNSIYRNKKYRCTYCSFQTFRLPELRRHVERKHGFILNDEPSIRRYLCSYCSYETDDKNHLFKHNIGCQIRQTRSRIHNNLLAPFDQFNRNMNTQMTTATIKSNKKQSISSKSQPHSASSTYAGEILDDNQVFETILIESDHDTSLSASSSDEDFIVSSDEASSSSTGHDDQDFELTSSRPKKPQPQSISKAAKPFVSHPNSLNATTSGATTLSSLSKLLLLNGTSIQSFTSNKPPLVAIQPKPSIGTNIYQMCNICGCYVYKNDFIKHVHEKHNIADQSQQTNLNNTTNNSNIIVTCVTPALTVAKKSTTQTTTSPILLLSTSTMNKQSITLNMIKCPWCDTNFEHIDIMTGHLMRYHRMTLAASKVVVAEQMKIQGTSSSQLSFMFKKEIEDIQKDFVDKIYWKISQPKVYLHQIDNLLCFVCHVNVDDIEQHFLTSHQIPMVTLNKIKQCCLCGFLCDKKKSSLLEHQLRTHSGVCYSSILKQFIRFEPSPPPLTTITVSKDNRRLSILPSGSPQNHRALATDTEKKFGCRKCDTSSRLFTFEELVQHLRVNHELNVKLHRRCIICQHTYPKGKEYNQHCLEHLNDENPSIPMKRHYDVL